jgi:aminoglycoside phosphotransferase (APT) family kinase protein
VVRYQIDAFDPDRTQEVQWRVIGKVLKAQLGEMLFDNMQQLWMNGFSRSAADGISMPEPLEFSPHICMLLQEEVPGLSVKALLKRSAQKEHFRQVARTLAKLHQCPIVPSRIFKVREHLMRCHPSHEFLVLACPELASSIDYIVKRAFEIEAALGHIKLAPVHADFHLGQVHLENSHTWLIDFDVLSYGDPATDLGNLLVFLKSKVETNPEMEDCVQAFFEEYFSLMDRKIAARIPLYESLSYLRRACKALRLQEEGWREKTGQMVQQGMAAIETMASRFRLADRWRAWRVDAVAELANNGVRNEARP